jgi:hypothetical protein
MELIDTSGRPWVVALVSKPIASNDNGGRCRPRLVYPDEIIRDR